MTTSEANSEALDEAYDKGYDQGAKDQQRMDEEKMARLQAEVDRMHNWTVSVCEALNEARQGLTGAEAIVKKILRG